MRHGTANDMDNRGEASSYATGGGANGSPKSLDPPKFGVVAVDRERPLRVDHALSLAYVGDAVWELYARNHLLARGIVKPHELQRESIRYVSAKSQAAALQVLLPLLTDEERSHVRRGKNAKAKTVPKNTPVRTYRESTAVEALIGYLYVTDQLRRIEQLMVLVFKTLDGKGGETNE
ncbi:Mini-ribonuclease 3 [Numidum massiliense]|uniref:Mini-ribonuclease 3 n=1 Tax=Numidum massiliense TaxID=1522315 RepID=UPI0028FCD6D3|nr:ribonuclease III domain-containing protein [Numidum massiliense]